MKTAGKKNGLAPATGPSGRSIAVHFAPESFITWRVRIVPRPALLAVATAPMTAPATRRRAFTEPMKRPENLDAAVK